MGDAGNTGTREVDRMESASSDFADALEGESPGAIEVDSRPSEAKVTDLRTDTCKGVSTPWGAELLRRAAVRDRQIEGVTDLYVQYSECLGSLQSLRLGKTNALGPCSLRSREHSPTLCPVTSSNLGQMVESLDMPRAHSPASSRSQAALVASYGRLQQDARQKDQEIEALRHVIREREEELQEKEQAHAILSRQATLLGRENAELKNHLERSQQQVQAMASEMRWLRQRGFDEGRGSELAEPPDPPAKQCILRKIHSAELTCVSGASGQSAPLPATLVAFGTADGFVKLVDAESVRPHAQISVSRELPRLIAVDLAPTSGLLLAASSDNALRLLDLRAQKLQHVLRGHLDSLSACGFLRGGAHAYTASMDRTVKLWDLEKGQLLRSLPTSDAATGAAAHAGSGLIAVGHADGGLAVWDPRVSDTLSMVTMIGKRGRAVVGLSVAPDGQTLLSQTEDGTLHHVALDSMRALLTLDGPGAVGRPSPPAFSPDGVYLLARSISGFRCWRASDGQLEFAHESPSLTAISWDLPRAVSAHRDGHAALWGVVPAADGGVSR
eukprot:TRINITY_DN31158_c0_g1_i1.p1 TRINITY_DN31158_c0_g1~~TRINITY_DN31158_c0_g1_i1.p1  ORF type:complete len:556 (+),score=81.30 TRINITY_DN31158_c0_g1_i1:167-1834(+)